MRYIKSHWLHAFSTEPVWLFSELDNESWEVRKVEVFADGRLGFAGEAEASEGTRLGEAPVPSIEEIDAGGEFETVEIPREEFEHLWSRRHQQAPRHSEIR